MILLYKIKYIFYKLALKGLYVINLNNLILCSNHSRIDNKTSDMRLKVIYMAAEEVEKYQLYYQPGKQTVKIWVKTKSGPKFYLVNELLLEKAAVLIDILRNEKPIYYYIDNSVLETAGELIGEGDKSP